MTSPEWPFCRRLAALDELPPEEVVWQFPHSVALLGPWQFYHGYKKWAEYPEFLGVFSFPVVLSGRQRSAERV